MTITNVDFDDILWKIWDINVTVGHSSWVGTLNLNNCYATISQCSLKGKGIRLAPAITMESSVIIVKNSIFMVMSATSVPTVMKASQNSSVEISNTVFKGHTGLTGIINISNHSKLIVNRCSFDDNSVHGKGGAIVIADHTTAKIYSSDFTNNSAKLGAAIFCVNDSRLEIQSSVLVGNKATYGGSIFAANNVEVSLAHTGFFNNTAIDYPFMSLTKETDWIPNGLDIRSLVSMQLSNAKVGDIYNFSLPSGGAIFMENWSSMSIWNSSFLGNSVIQGTGGAIRLSGHSTMTVYNNSQFASNNAYYGGCFSVDNGSHVLISNTSMHNNIAFYGAVVWSQHHTRISCQASYIIGNRGSGGRAIMFITDNVNISLDSCKVEDNRASIYSAGGIYASSSCVVNFWKSQFNNNSANQDGGLVDLYYSSVLNIDNSSFTHTKSGSFGGVIHSKDNNIINIRNSYFANNSATLEGGVIQALLGTSLEIENSTFEDNNSTGGFGGVVYGLVNVSLSIRNSVLRRNRAGYSGGAIAADFHSCLTLVDSNIYDNMAAISAGAIFAQTANVSCRNTNVTRNIALRRGGGVLAISGTSITLEQTCFLGNNVTMGSGGGIFAESNVYLRVSASQFVENWANEYGGGFVVIENAVMKVEFSIFQGNHAGFMGGAILADTDSKLWSIYCRYIGNTANGLAGAVKIQVRTVGYFTECIFQNNTAIMEGGSFHLNSGTLSVSKCNFEVQTFSITLKGLFIYLSEEIESPSSMYSFKSNFSFDGTELSTSDPGFTEKAIDTNFMWLESGKNVHETVYASRKLP